MEAETGVEIALVGGERGVIESPVGKIVGRSVAVPIGDGHIEGDLHPVPLRLVVAVHWGVPLPRVRAQRNQHS